MLPVFLWYIWGFDVNENIEIVQRKFCRRLLGVKKNTPTASVLGDCGRLPLMYTYYKKCISYWIKLLEMSNDRLPKQCYLLNKQLSESGYDTWAGRVKKLLDKYGFSYVWINQSVGNKDMFLMEFSQRVKDCYIQNWQESVNDSSKLHFYGQIKINYEPAPYVKILWNRKLISAVAKLQCCGHNLNVERARYVQQEGIELCLFCHVVEDEFHFMCKCSVYQELRIRYFSTPLLSESQLKNIMNSKNEDIILKLSLYINNSFKLRETLLN